MPKKPTAPASRSAGSRSAPAAHFVRFTEAQNVRLHRICARERRTITAYLSGAALVAMDASDRKHAEETGAEAAQVPRAVPDRSPPTPGGGYGLRQKISWSDNPYEDNSPPAEAADVAPEPAPVSPSPQIVINAGGGNSASTPSDVERLSAFIARGAPAERDGRLRIVGQIIDASTNDDAERVNLVRAIEERVKALGANAAVPPPRKSPLDFLGDFFKV